MTTKKNKHFILVEYAPVNQVVHRFCLTPKEQEIETSRFINANQRKNGFIVHHYVAKTLERLKKQIIQISEKDIPQNEEKVFVLVVRSSGDKVTGDPFIDTNESYWLYKNREEVIMGIKKEEKKNASLSKERSNPLDLQIDVEIPETEEREKEKAKKLVDHDKLFFYPEFVLIDVLFGDEDSDGNLTKYLLTEIKDAKALCIIRQFVNYILDEIEHETFKHTYKELIRDGKTFFPTIFGPLWEKVILEFNVTNQNRLQLLQKYREILELRIKKKFMFAPNYHASPSEFIFGIKELKFNGIHEIFKKMLSSERNFTSKYIVFAHPHNEKYVKGIEQLYATTREEMPFIPLAVPTNTSFYDVNEEKELICTDHIEYFFVMRYVLRKMTARTIDVWKMILKLEKQKEEYLYRKLQKLVFQVMDM